MHKTPPLVGLAAAVLLPGLAGCADGTSTQAPPRSEVEMTTAARRNVRPEDRPVESRAPAPLFTSSAHPELSTAASLTDTPSASPMLTDGQIAAIAATVDRAEIVAGTYAMAHARNAQVRQFAQHMAAAHTDLEARLMGIVEAESLSLTDSDVDVKLKAALDNQNRSLMRPSAEGFDRAYIADQLRGYQALLDLIDTTLIPNAQNASLKRALAETRSMVVERIQMARDVQPFVGGP